MTDADASRDAGAADLIESLLEQCIERAEQDGEAGVDEVCARHPALAETLRRELAILRRLGLLDLAGAAAAAPPVERIGDFRILRTLGRGGMGVVYLAEQVSLRRHVALKVLRTWSCDGAGAARFQREAQTIARLRHPSIVTLYGAGDDGDARWLAMELVPGRGLDELLAEGRGTPLAIQNVVRFGAELARALACAHAAGVVHRDVKPSNTRVTPDGRAMLLDFGLARDLAEPALTCTGAFQGSPHYASPEQIRGGRSPVDARSDVYSLGATLYECATGSVPFAGETTEQVFHRILTREPEAPRRRNPAVPRDLEIAILKALEKDPGSRYPSAAALAADLEAILGLRPIAARRPSRLVGALKWARRNRAAATAAAAALLALAVAAGALLLQAHRARLRARADVVETLAEARARLDAFRDGRASLAEIETRVTVLLEDLEYRYLRPEEDRLLDRKEQELEQARRQREELWFAVDALLDRAEEADPGNAAARELRVLLYLEKMQEAEVARDERLADFYRDQAIALDPAGAPALSTRGEVSFASDPPGATVRLFRYREQSELDPDGEPRLVPVPLGHAGELATPIPPGTFTLRVVRGAGAVAAGDLIVLLNGFPIAGTMLVAEGAPPVAAFDRLVSVDGEPLPGPYDLERIEGTQPAAAGAGSVRVYEFARGAERFTVEGKSLASLGISVLPPAAVAERGGAPATVLRAGRLEPITLPEGLVVRSTAAPAIPHPHALELTTPSAPIGLDPGGYLALYSLEGYESVRQSLRVERTHSARAHVRLDPVGTTPDGFVRVTNCAPELAPGVADFWMQEREVTFAEYLEFLNDPATLQEVEAGAAERLVPHDREGEHCARGADGRFTVARETRPDWPVFGVTWFGAQAYAGWRTDNARAAGAHFEFALPTFGEWKLGGHGADRRVYAYGMRFRPKWAKSNYSRPVPDPEPVMRHPVDETIFGAFDTSGSVMEWLDDWYREGEAYRRAAGGSWGQSDPDNAFLVQGGLGVRPEQVWNIVGFRLVARPRH